LYSFSVNGVGPPIPVYQFQKACVILLLATNEEIECRFSLAWEFYLCAVRCQLTRKQLNISFIQHTKVFDAELHVIKACVMENKHTNREVVAFTFSLRMSCTISVLLLAD
jgi:hypothetical protein